MSPINLNFPPRNCYFYPKGLKLSIQNRVKRNCDPTEKMASFLDLQLFSETFKKTGEKSRFINLHPCRKGKQPLDSGSSREEEKNIEAKWNKYIIVTIVLSEFKAYLDVYTFCSLQNYADEKMQTNSNH